MLLRIFVEPQMGATYEQQLRVAQAAEAAGFDAFFRSDHFLTMGGDGLPGRVGRADDGAGTSDCRGMECAN